MAFYTSSEYLTFVKCETWILFDITGNNIEGSHNFQ